MRVDLSVRKNARTVRVFGSVAFEICQVAAGNTDAHFYGSAALWDGVGPAFIAEKAVFSISYLVFRIYIPLEELM